MKDNPNFALAGTTDFDEFVRKFNVANYENWFGIDGADLPNLQLVRVERLEEDFNRYAREFGYRPIDMPHTNRSDSGAVANWLKEPGVVDAINAKYAALFDRGLYSRRAA